MNADKTIEIDPQYKFTKLWDLMEKDKLTYDFIYHIINNNKFLIEFEEEHKLINEDILETDQENIIKSAIENNSSELKIIDGPFTNIDNFDQEACSYFETHKSFQQNYLDLQEAWEQENFKKVGNLIMLKVNKAVVREGASLLLTGKYSLKFDGLTDSYDNKLCYQKFMISEHNYDDHSWEINNHGILKSKGIYNPETIFTIQSFYKRSFIKIRSNPPPLISYSNSSTSIKRPLKKKSSSSNKKLKQEVSPSSSEVTTQLLPSTSSSLGESSSLVRM
jgi:hypothetical protein